MSMLNKHVRRPIASVKKFLKESLAVFQVEFIKLFREPTELFSRAVQPILWIVIFGQVFSRSRGIPTGEINYLSFMAPGILAQSVLFSAIFYGIAVIWERDLGVVHKMLVSPAYRSSLVFGKALSAGLRGLIQAAIIYAVSFFMDIRLNIQPALILGVLCTVVLGSSIFSTFSLIIACIVKTRERFMGIGQVLTMPLFFASNAIYPIEMMPGWLKIVSRLNPLTYLVDTLRDLMIVGGQSTFGLGLDFLILWSMLFIFVIIASVIYPRLVR
ncbi:MAG: ABC transporter permease [Bdellovibrio sp.]